MLKTKTTRSISHLSPELQTSDISLKRLDLMYYQKWQHRLRSLLSHVQLLNSLCFRQWPFFQYTRSFGISRTVVTKLWYAYHEWHAKAFKVVQYTSRLTFCFSSHKKTVFTVHAFTFAYRVLWRNSCIFVFLFLMVLENGHYNFSLLFSTCRFCVKSSFLNFWSNDIWLNAFSWNKVVRGDSTFDTNGTRSEKVWETLL